MLELKQPAFNLDLKFEDVESKSGGACCGASTTHPLCTCPIRWTDCCELAEFQKQ